MSGEIKIIFPFSGDCIMSLTLTRQISREQFKTMMELIALAEDSFCVDSTEAASQPPTPASPPER